MRVGVIGCGSIGSRHKRNLEALGHDVAICDKRSELLPHFRDVADMQRYYAPDAVLICTPASTHASVAQELLSLSYTGPLFCEKPLALSSAECDVFRSWPHPTTMVGYMLRFHPLMRIMRDIVGLGISGGFYCDCDAQHWPGSSYGPWMLECSHELDLALWCGAKADGLHASRITDTAADIWLDAEERWLFSFDVKDSSYVRHWMLTGVRHDMALRFRSPEELGDRMYGDELAHFLFCVEQKIPTKTPFADGIRVVDVCEQAMKLAGASA